MNNYKKQNNKGFTILFAVLVSTLVLSVGASVINIALKQLALSGSARDSQFAFYAANTGIECAAYWDFVGVEDVTIPVFATSSDTITTLAAEPDIESDLLSSVKCSTIFIIDGDDTAASNNPNYTCEDSLSEDKGWCVDYNTESATTSFRIDPIAPGVEYCVDVTIAKYLDSESRTRTNIESRGYNTCIEDNPRRVERGLRITY